MFFILISENRLKISIKQNEKKRENTIEKINQTFEFFH
jgi:hypothetical protein